MTTAAVPPSARTRIRRHPERAESRATAEAILQEGLVAHVALVRGGDPVVLPFTYHYGDGRLYLHGAPAAGTMRALRKGVPVCVEVTLVDALIASRTAENHSINYRTAVCFGRARLVADRERKRGVLEAMISRYFPGRTAGIDYAAITIPEFKKTDLFEVEIDAISAKVRAGGPKGPVDADASSPYSAGIVPLAGGKQPV